MPVTVRGTDILFNNGTTQNTAARFNTLLSSYTISTSVTSIVFNNLGSWSGIIVSLEDVVASTNVNYIQVSNDNGSSFFTSGYVGAIQDLVSTTAYTAGFQITRGNSGANNGLATIVGMNQRPVFGSTIGNAGRGAISGGSGPSGVMNAIRITNSTYSSGVVKVYGVVIA